MLHPSFAFRDPRGAAGTRLREDESTRVMMELCCKFLILNGWVNPGEEPLVRA